ncbi:MAG: FkbM family methyltransferase [Bacteroidales bacterium]|nr:FkbM family methyltransferase [Bacteroidales bacterium]MDD4209059.1 FkbM family methyltransferase [Bacteroidales bacterium]
MRIKKLLFNIANDIIPQFLFRKNAYAQDGEDMLLASFFENKKKYKGFYVDVGAHHPYRFSNTAYFYKKGWRGINIEPTPSLFKKFIKHRKKDINLNIGIGKGEVLTFHIFNDGALNTFDSEIAKERDGSHNRKYYIIEKINIHTYPLKDILDRNLPHQRKIDLLTIDVEGFDFEVIQSNDWNKYIPTFILIECESTIDDIQSNSIYQFLKAKNYTMVGRTQRTSLFKHN